MKEYTVHVNKEDTMIIWADINNINKDDIFMQILKQLTDKKNKNDKKNEK